MGYVIAALGIGFMIAIHEFGHFIVAKLSGMVVTEYSLGMGPAIWSRTWGETTYALRLFPIGGYVSVWGEDSLESVGANQGKVYDPARHYENISRWKRGLFIAAGPAMNVITALVVALGISMFTGGRVESVIVAKEGSNALHWQGTTMTVEETDLEQLDARLGPGDKIKSVDGYPLLCAQDLAYFALSPTGSVELKVDRDGKSQKIPDVALENLYVDLEVRANTALYKLDTAIRLTISNVVMTLAGLKMLFTGAVSVTEVSGPVGVVAVMGQTVQQSSAAGYFDALLLFSAISANLGIMNLLPIPALDGGHLMFLGIECAMNKPVPKKIQMVTQYAMFVLLFALMIVVAGMDIYGLFTGKFVYG